MADSANTDLASGATMADMRWAHQFTVGAYKWHLVREGQEPFPTYRGQAIRTECVRSLATSGLVWMPKDRRPALARNNVCARCTKLYLRTRPELQGFIDRLNDKKDV